MQKHNPIFSTVSKAQIVCSRYKNDDIVVADIICDIEHGYNVDSSGLIDSTKGIQKALNDCFDLGGGTVYLPLGKYIVSKTIEVPPFVCLHGDKGENNALDNNETVILCCVSSCKKFCGKKVNVFRLSGSTALINLTFFYPNQSVESVVPYGYCVEIPGKIDNIHHYMFTLKNLTFINAYRGICCSLPIKGKSFTHEQLYIENVKGTFLKNAMYLTNSSEVGAFNKIDISTRFWKNAQKLNVAQERKLNEFCKENLHALIFGDLEWQQIENIGINCCNTGIEFLKGTRFADPPLAFIGSFFNLKIEDCINGLIVNAMYIRLGIEFTRCKIKSERIAVANYSSVSEGQLMFCGANLSGEIIGPNIYVSDYSYESTEYLVKDLSSYIQPPQRLYNVLEYGILNNGLQDISDIAQKMLNEIEQKGGGVVYFPAGKYKIIKPLEIGKQTQIRGAGQHITKDLRDGYCLGTTFLCYGETAFILSGKKASLCSVKIIYPEQNVFYPQSLTNSDFAIKITGENSCVLNVYFVNANKGIQVQNSQNFLLKRVMGGFFRGMFSITKSKGVIDTCLSNAIASYFVSSDIVDWNLSIEEMVKTVYPFSRENNVILTAKDSSVEIRGLFTYASNTFFKTYNSNITAVNVGFDSQPIGQGCCFNLSNSSVKVYNVLRDACGTLGELYKKNSSSLSMFNLITLVLNNSVNPECDIVDNIAKRKMVYKT